ncbi:molecular chaperone GroES [Aerococcus urinaehominis]|uniref:Co-chaperonin GroES n=1 Tax=Aerococcus urinaehominis TaxID=128944 RepID=A0A109RGP2_9LACT|nr:co-chaperone GroES [Aerococcus urinaehominis]AMB99401.1 molecular chaperone GroES [Aerococcus urinaehominis]SDM23952.1 chaperonin GroES [Aerococcus urinaehominis]
MLKPLNERVVIQVEEAEEKTASGIVLPSSAKEKSQIGRVVAVSDDSSDFSSQLSAGDRVIFEKYAGSEVSYEGQDYLIVKEKDIAAVIK